MNIVESVKEISDLKYKAMAILSADPATRVRRIKAMQAMGATAVVIMNVSGADPLGTVRFYGEHVLPACAASCPGHQRQGVPSTAASQNSWIGG